MTYIHLPANLILRGGPRSEDLWAGKMPVIVSVSLTRRQRSLDGRRSRGTMARRWLCRAVAAGRRYLGAHPRPRGHRAARRFRRSWLTYQEAQSGGRRRSMSSHAGWRFSQMAHSRSLTLTCTNTSIRRTPVRMETAWRGAAGRRENRENGVHPISPRLLTGLEMHAVFSSLGT